MKRLTLLGMMILGALATPSAHAGEGGWTSGGGEILKDANNPWFVYNTTQVRYCVDLDLDVFGDLPTPASELIERAIGYWKNEFAKPQVLAPSYPPKGTIGVGTQEFVQVACSENVDLRFQLGVLSDEQKKYLQNPKDLLGISVRTGYDRVNLRGKGFIYISPDRGPDAYEGDGLAPGAWHVGNSGILFRVLVHELGHVFGLPHSVNGIMAHSYPELLVRLADMLGPGIGMMESMPGFFLPNLSQMGTFYCEWEGDPLAEPRRKFFGMPAGHHCIGASVDGDSPYADLYSSPTEGSGQTQSLGRIRFSESRAEFSEMGVRVFLPKEQTVFPLDGISEAVALYGGLIGPSRPFTQTQGTFEPASTATGAKPVIMTFGPSQVRLGGVVDDKIHLDLVEVSLWNY